MTPAFLQQGDQIRIISPSGAIDPRFIDGASKAFEAWGLCVTEGTHARTTYGRFGGTLEQRLADLQASFDDPEVKAVLCSRGGYGIAQLIDSIDFSAFKKQPKWLIGFSDITILHSAISIIDIASVHAVMAKQLTELSSDDNQVQLLKSLLFGNLPSYQLPLNSHNKMGQSEGKLIGGNLSVLAGMIGTSFDLPYDNNILFIEEINEQPYHIDRMMQNLRLSGALAKINGLVVGQFAGCDDDALMMQTVPEIILDAVKAYNYPVCFNFPAGHVEYNLPLVMGQRLSLKVDGTGSSLVY